MSDYDCPGVYIEEDASLALSIASGATAIPIFAHDKTLLTADTPIRLDSWLAFMNQIDIQGKTPEQLKQNLLYLSLKTYFDNGGGYCYVCPKGKLEEVVRTLDDVTLIVAAGLDVKEEVGRLFLQDGAPLFAILDGPNSPLSNPTADTEKFDSSPYAAVYYPWLNADWAKYEDGGSVVSPDIPPSAAVAGAYCMVDRERGVWKAPANVGLKGGVQPKYNVSDTTQGKYNTAPKPINMIRVFRGTDPLIWGARTLSGESDVVRWRYVPVRRLFNAAEKDIRKAMRVAIFEPNSQPTWEKVRSAIDNYLHSIWRQGGLMGVKPEEAYFVQIGKGVTMTEDDILQGKMIVKIGMAAVRPAEFIILQFTQDMATA